MDTPMVTQLPHDTGNWVLRENFEYGDVTVPKGFVTDYASIPRLFWNIISPWDLGRGPVGHDWEYRNKIGRRKRADLKFLAYMKRDGIPAWKRTVAYRMVRLFGGSSWGTGKVRIITLPAAGTAPHP